MPINSNWFRPKLNGVEFEALDTSMPELGRKVAEFNYPNTSSRYIEDMGGIKGVYQITARIRGNNNTPSSFKRNKKKFQKALNQEGLSVLIHPTKGRKKVVITKASEQEPVQGNIGFAIYNFEAREADKNKFPTSTGGFNLLKKLSKLIGVDLEKALKDATELLETSAEYYNSFRDAVDNVSDTINDVLGTINGFADEFGGLVADLQELKVAVNNAIAFPAQFISKFQNIFESLLGVTDNMFDLFKATENSFNSLPQTTGGTSLSNKAQDSINLYTKASLLNATYQIAGAIEYNNQQEIDNVIKRTEAMFNAIDPNYIDDAVYTALENIRTQQILALNNLKLSLPYTKTIQTKEMPAVVLAYNYYGDQLTSQYEKIVAINNIQDASTVKDKVTIVTVWI